MIFMYTPEVKDRIQKSPFFKEVFFVEKVDSTNTWARKWLFKEKKPLDGDCIVIGMEQTSGRGRDNHQWWSPPGMIALTLLTTWSSFGLSRIGSAKLSHTIAKAVANTFNYHIYNTIDIKTNNICDCHARFVLPNDIYVGSKKIAGILIESPDPENLIIGIGMDLNNQASEAPESLRDQITTLYDICHQETDPAEFILTFFSFLRNHPFQQGQFQLY